MVICKNVTEVNSGRRFKGAVEVARQGDSLVIWPVDTFLARVDDEFVTLVGVLVHLLELFFWNNRSLAFAVLWRWSQVFRLYLRRRVSGK